MQVIPRLVHKVIPEVLLSLLDPVPLGLILDLVCHVLLLVLVEEGGHHSNGEHVVDELEEAFLEDVSVGEEEEDGALAKQAQQCL